MCNFRTALLPAEGSNCFMLDIQKASVFKRLGAYLLDMILLITLVIGAWSMFSHVVKYDDCAERLKGYYEKYEQEYGVDFSISMEEYDALEDAELQKYIAANEAMNQDQDALDVYNMKIYLEMMLISSSVLLAYTILEIVIPLLLKNGQTVGKKIFGLCVMHKDGVRVSAIQVCFRALLGKYTIETMLPIMIYILKIYRALGTTGSLIVALLVMVQLFFVLYTRTNRAIHDMLCNTVVVDYHSQMIFDCEEDLIAYKEAYAAEMAKEADY